MKPTTIHLVFENRDWVEIPAVFVKQLRINSIQGSSVWYSDCNSKEGHYCENQYTADLLIRLDYSKCVQEVKTTYYGDSLDRLFKYNDISYIGLSFEDESLNKSFGVVWSEKDEYDNAYQSSSFEEDENILVIKVKKD